MGKFFSFFFEPYIISFRVNIPWELYCIELIFTVLSLILFSGSMMIGLIFGVYFVRTGKPFRDKVQGPNEKGVSFLYTLAASAPDPEESREAVWALQLMLMGQEPSHSGLTFLRAKANKYKEKVPEAIEALNTMEYIFVMQQAGKATADLELLEEPIPCSPPRMQRDEAELAAGVQAMRLGSRPLTEEQSQRDRMARRGPEEELHLVRV